MGDTKREVALRLPLELLSALDDLRRNEPDHLPSRHEGCIITTITRFATSAFMRMKLREAFTRRNIAPHVFEKKEDAQAFLASALWSRR
jgi:hypothetical protein